MSESNVVLSLVVLLFSVVVHEFAHGWVANKLGDDTARRAGRLTLNPLVHIDLIWTILIPVIMYMTLGFIFGWAKPVPINHNNFKNPKSGIAISAAAGPISNMLLAIISIIIFRVLLHTNLISDFSSQFLQHAVLINTVLMAFNLIPIPPLDGSKVLMGFMSYRHAIQYEQLSHYGSFILLGLILLGNLTGVSVFGFVITPLINFVYNLMFIGL